MHTAMPLPASSPTTLVSRLAYAGLAPFVLGAVLVWLVRADALPYVALALSGYAAATLAFLGGIHWGIAFKQAAPSTLPIAWGVVPAFVAAVAVIMPPYAGLVIFGAMFVACYAVDRRVYAAQGLSAWLGLRFRQCAVAATSCFIAAAGA
jgi:hypothetical protein